MFLGSQDDFKLVAGTFTKAFTSMEEKRLLLETGFEINFVA